MRTVPRLPAAMVFVCISVFSSRVGLAQQSDVPTPATPIVGERTFENLFPNTVGVDRLSPSFSSAPDAAARSREETTEPTGAPSRHAFSTLYAGLVATQALDVHSTI